MKQTVNSKDPTPLVYETVAMKCEDHYLFFIMLFFKMLRFFLRCRSFRHFEGENRRTNEELGSKMQ